MQDIYNRLLSYATLKGGIFPTTFVNYELVNYDLANLLSPTVLPRSPDPGDLGTYRMDNKNFYYIFGFYQLVFNIPFSCVFFAIFIGYCI